MVIVAIEYLQSQPARQYAEQGKRILPSTTSQIQRIHTPNAPCIPSGHSAWKLFMHSFMLAFLSSIPSAVIRNSHHKLLCLFSSLLDHDNRDDNRGNDSFNHQNHTKYDPVS